MPNNFDVFYERNTGIAGFFGGILNAILGKPGGKFSGSRSRYQPVNPKQFLIDCGYNSLMKVAMEVPHLNTILSRGAELFSLMEIKHIDKNGKEIENSKVLKFLKKPNPLQTIEQYLYQYYVTNGIYNKTFQFKLKGLSYEKIPKAMWLLPSGSMQVNATGKVYRQADIKDIVTNYELVGTETKETFETDQVIYMAEGIGVSILNPVSRVEALQMPLSNIIAALKSRNIIISERGMIGFIKTKSATGTDPQPPDKEEVARMRKEYQNEYSLDSRGGHVGMTSLDAEWVPMTFNIAELGLLEGVEADFAALCDAYGHDRDIYSSTKGATFENKMQGLKSTINNGLQPVADKLLRTLTAELLEEGSGEQLIASYDHLPVMKEDELKEAQAKQTNNATYSQQFNDGVIDKETYHLLAGITKVEDANAPKTAAQAKLRGLVGTQNSIITLNQNVAQGFMDKQSAISVLVNQLGYEPGLAATMITSTTVDPSIKPPSGASSGTTTE